MPISTIGSAGLDQAANVTLCTTSGSVGIGTASPDSKLAVYNATGTSQIRFGASSNYYWDISRDNDVTGNLLFSNNNATSRTTRMTIDSSGNVGIGTASPDIYSQGGRMFTVSNTTASGYAHATFIGGSGGGGEVDFGNQTVRHAAIASLNGSSLSFYTNSTNSGVAVAERMRIDSSGNLLVGKNVTSVGTAGTWIDATGALVSSLAASTASSSTLHAYSTTASAYRFYVGMDGRVNATLTTISAISDERLKENIKDLDFGLSEVLSLKPRRFDWKEGKGADTKDAVGFIAQEFETVFPNSVGTAKAGEDGIEYKNICHDELIPTLVKAIQELKALVDTQASTITQLQADVAALKGQA